MSPFKLPKGVLMCSVILVAVCAAGCPPTTPGGPEADFSADVTSGPAPLTVQFTDLSNLGLTPIASWFWSFGDSPEGTSTEQNPVHTYNAVGTYNVSLTVTTENGENTALKRSFISIHGKGEIKTETVMLPGEVLLEMVWIPAGSFMMGRYASEQDSYDIEDPQHQVTFATGFWMSKYEVTQAQWQAVMGTNPSAWPGASRPVEQVSWNNIQSFIAKLNTATGRTFRLPSEAEWEYACRAGTLTRFYWGDDPDYTQIGSYAWYGNNSSSQTHEVGAKLPNAWGLYDMNGNVWEWCQDWYHSSYWGAPTDGVAWELPTGTDRVLRGGSWYYDGSNCRSSSRSSDAPAHTNLSLGVRLVRTP